MKTMPQIVNFGFYDAVRAHGDVVSTRPRRTSIYELEYATDDGGVTYIDNQFSPVRKGNVILSKPGQLRHTDLPYQCLFIHAIIDDEDVRTMLRSVPDIYLPVNHKEFENAFNELISQLKLGNHRNDIDMSIKFLEILSMFIKTSQNPVSEHNIKSIHDAINFIDTNYTENITLNDIASHVHLSKIYFHNFFRKITGQTPHEYLLSTRINNVKFLLTMTDKSFSEIAYECGFSSQAYMTYVFKRKTSLTPMQYKKMINNL